MELLELVLMILIFTNMMTNMEVCSHGEGHYALEKKITTGYSAADYYERLTKVKIKSASRASISKHLNGVIANSSDNRMLGKLLPSIRTASNRDSNSIECGEQTRLVNSDTKDSTIYGFNKSKEQFQKQIKHRRTSGVQIKVTRTLQADRNDKVFIKCDKLLDHRTKRSGQKSIVRGFESVFEFKNPNLELMSYSQLGVTKRSDSRVRRKKNIEKIKSRALQKQISPMDTKMVTKVSENIYLTNSNLSQRTDQLEPETTTKTDLLLDLPPLPKKPFPFLENLNKSLILKAATRRTQTTNIGPFVTNSILPSEVQINAEGNRTTKTTFSIPSVQNITDVVILDKEITLSPLKSNSAKSISVTHSVPQESLIVKENQFTKTTVGDQPFTKALLSTKPGVDTSSTTNIILPHNIATVVKVRKKLTSENYLVSSDLPAGIPETHTFTLNQELNVDSFSTQEFVWNVTEENVTMPDLMADFKRMYPVSVWKSQGLFTEKYLKLINPHWLQFPPPPPVNHYILAALYVVIMSIGMLGNALVVLMFIRCRSLQTPANILVMNLAVSDFLLLSKMPVFVYNCIYHGPILGELGCQIYAFLGGLTGTVSITTLAAIALDRYYVIVYPLDPMRKTTRCRARMCVLFVWCYGGVFSTLPLLKIGFGSYVPEGYLTSCSFDYLDPSFNNRLFIFIFFLAAWFVPFCVITVCYVGICRAVVLARNVKHVAGNDSSRHEKNRSEVRLAGVVIGIVGLWFMSWTPYAIVALLGISGQKRFISPLSSMIPALFCKAASCIDPYVYAVTHPRFRLEISSLVRRVSTKRKMRSERQRSSKAWSTNYEMTDVTKHHIRRESRHQSEDSDVEEMVVIVGSKPDRKESVSSSDDEAFEQQRINPMDCCDQKKMFPITKADSLKFQPPTWFVAPKPVRDRGTSFKQKNKSLDLKRDLSL